MSGRLRGMRTILLVGAVSALFCCAPSKQACDFTTCATGCCDSDGVCQTGDSNLACGQGGLSCNVCLAGSCRFGTCELSNVVGGGAGTGGGGDSTGGGGGTGGGIATGGGDASGGGSGTGGGVATGGGMATTCEPTCPSGFTCNAGSCVGGDLETLTFDVRTARLTLDLRKNGAALPSLCIGDDIAGRVNLYDPDDSAWWGTGYLKSCTQPLLDSSHHADPTTLTTKLQGAALFGDISYRSSVRGPDILVSGPTTVTVDLTLIPVTGRALVNGQPVACSTEGSTAGWVMFAETDVSIAVDAKCTQGVVRFSADLPIRSYRVYFSSFDSDGALPFAAPALVAGSLQITAATASVDLNTSAAPVTFTIRENGGAVPCPSSGGWLSYMFGNAENVFPLGLSAPCVAGVGYQFTHRMMPGDYKLVLSSYNNGLLPAEGDFTRTVTIASSDTSKIIDLQTTAVSGTITVNGAPLTNCASGSKVYALRVGDTWPFWLPVSCGATTTFQGRLPVGDFDFYLDLPSNEWPSNVAWVQRRTAGQGLSFALTTRTVTFSALANGVVPQSTCTGSDARVSWRLEPDVMVGGSSTEVSVSCGSAGFSRSAVIFQGVSKVELTSARSTLPYRQKGLLLDSRISGAFSSDVVTRRMAGALTVNGQAAGCTSADRGFISGVDAQDAVTANAEMVCLNGGWLFELPVPLGTRTFTVLGTGGGLPTLRGATIGRFTVQ